MCAQLTQDGHILLGRTQKSTIPLIPMPSCRLPQRQRPRRKPNGVFDLVYQFLLVAVILSGCLIPNKSNVRKVYQRLSQLRFEGPIYHAQEGMTPEPEAAGCLVSAAKKLRETNTGSQPCLHFIHPRTPAQRRTALPAFRMGLPRGINTRPHRHTQSLVS